MIAGSTRWLLYALVLAGLAAGSYYKGWSTGLLWKALAAGAALCVAVCWYKRRADNLAPSLGADYRAAPGAMPSGSKLPAEASASASAPAAAPAPAPAL